MSCLSDTKFVYYLYSTLKLNIMLKRFVKVLWTYSPEDYWKALWSKTQIDEKVKAKAKRVKKAVKVLKGK